MIPKKSKDLIKLVAEKLQTDEYMARDVIDFFWKDVRKNLLNMTHTEITIPGMGRFRIKYWKLPDLLMKYNDYKNGNYGGGFRQAEIILKSNERIELINNLINHLNKEAERKEEIKRVKENEKHNNRTLEE